MNKKGFQSSVNFIVTIIVAIVILGFGISIFADLFQQANDFSRTIDASTKAQLDTMLDDGEIVTVLKPVRTVNIGDEVVFTVGLTNNDVSASFFALNIGNPSASTVNFLSATYLKYNSDLFQIDLEERKYVPFLVEIPHNLPAGSYTFDVWVCKDQQTCASGSPNQHGFTQKIYLNVR